MREMAGPQNVSILSPEAGTSLHEEFCTSKVRNLYIFNVELVVQLDHDVGRFEATVGLREAPILGKTMTLLHGQIIATTPQ